jgi:hypothetical protein
VVTGSARRIGHTGPDPFGGYLNAIIAKPPGSSPGGSVSDKVLTPQYAAVLRTRNSKTTK